MKKETMVHIMDGIVKWLPVIGTAIIQTIIDEKREDKKKIELKEEIIKELKTVYETSEN